MNRKLLIFAVFVLLILSVCCTINKTEEQSVLKSYRTLTPVTVTVDMIDQIIKDLNYSDFKDNTIRQLIIYPVKVYKITYRTNYKGTDIFASGAVTIPEMDGVFPILSFHHGTIFKDSRAPSRYGGGDKMEAETAMNIIFGSTGFICASPDLIGYGDSTKELHPYHLFDPTVKASIDMLRAVKELCVKLGKEVSGQYFLTGYSEGGYAAMAVQKEIQLNHSDEFPVAAASIGAGAYYLSQTITGMLNNNTLISPAYISFIITAYNEYYGWGRDLSGVFRDPYFSRIYSGILTGDLFQDQINDQLTERSSNLFTNQFLSDFRGSGEEQLKAALSENNLYSDWSPRVQTRLYHGSRDNLIPPFNSENAYITFKQAGSGSVEFISLKRKNHETAIIPFIKATLIWFNSF